MRRSSSSNGTASSSNKRRKVDSTEGRELGKIESISLRNFMCHDNFEFEFGPQMNFIIGQNGSGKSAILTGIILALGGKSKVTGRFSNIKGFIKTGKQRAKIEIVLQNCGDLAYKPEVYGTKIRVVREITSDGVSSYKLKSEAGVVVSSQKEELNHILNNMDIHVDNPIQVLTQETSRNFLLSKHAKGEKLFELFFKGTGLQKLNEDYNETKIIKDTSAEDLDRKKQALPPMEAELRRWKKFLESSAKIDDYKKELIWAGISEMERILEKKEEENEKILEDTENCKTAMRKCKDALDAKTAEQDDYVKKKTECNLVLSEYRNKIQKLKSDHENCTLNLRRHEGSLGLSRREEKKISDEIQSLEIRINENTQKKQTDVKEEERKYKIEVERLQNENENLRATLEDLKKKKNSKMEEQGQMRHKIDSLNAELVSHNYNQRKLAEHRNRSIQALKNKVNVFGDMTEHVLKEIKARKREFKIPPVGPIGMYLGVKDPKWSLAVEKCLTKNLLCSYCVDNHKDDHILKGILKKYCGTNVPSTIVCPFAKAVHDVTPYKTQTNFPTVLDMLEIKDIQVANALIDQKQIESKILIEDTNTGQNFMISNPPKNCYAAYILNCDQICLDPYRYYSETRPNQRSLLSSIRQDDVKQLDEQIDMETTEINKKKAQRNQLQRLLEKIPFELKKLDNEIVKLSIMQKNNLEKIKDLDCAKETEDVYCLQEDLQTLQQEREKKQLEINDAQKEVAKYRAEKEKIVSEVEATKVLLQNEKAKYDELSRKIYDCGHDTETLSTGKKKYENEVKAHEKKLQVMQKEVEEIRRKTEIATSNAMQVCPRIDTERSCEVIRRQLAETEKVVEEQSNCDKKELHNKYIEKLHAVKQAKEEMKKIEGWIATIDSMLKFRQKKFNEIQKHTRSVINLTFLAILEGNGYTGNLIFNEKDRTLKLDVAPTKGQNSRQNHSILSGGERSFVTIAFLLALWERTSMPFRVLDEYDVFMDSNNRQLSIDLLIRKAEDMPKSQFIFLSPLDLPQIKQSECVKIHKMVPPKRIDGGENSAS